MKVSIITATSNSEKNILDCLQSVARQTYKKIEHIIIDGDSTNNTIEILLPSLQTRGKLLVVLNNIN